MVESQFWNKNKIREKFIIAKTSFGLTSSISKLAISIV